MGPSCQQDRSQHEESSAKALWQHPYERFSADLDVSERLFLAASPWAQELWKHEPGTETPAVSSTHSFSVESRALHELEFDLYKHSSFAAS